MGTVRVYFQPLRQRLTQWLTAHPPLHTLLRALGAGIFCFVLSGASLLSDHVPLALAPVCALPFGLGSICAYLGAVLGYSHFWGLSAALEPVAAGFLMLAGSCLFQDLLPPQRRSFAPAAADGIYALLGIIFVLQANGSLTAVLKLVLRLALLWIGVRVLCPAEQTPRLRLFAAAVFLLAGLVRVELPFGVPLAAVFASAVCLLPEETADALALGAACGLVLDLGSTPSPPQTACFCLPLLVCRLLSPRRTARAAIFSGFYFLCVLIWGGTHAGWALGVLAGAVFSCFLPLLPASKRESAAAEAGLLVRAADVLQVLQARLALAEPETQTAPALIFDSAAETVCRSCVRQQDCWQTHADDTYRLLSACAGKIMQQGQANAGDLPAGFCAVCIREAAFRAAVNQALRTEQSQLLAIRQREESRQIACALFGHLSGFLRAAAQQRPSSAAPRYQLCLGVRAVGLRGDTLCGDCGANFQYGCTQYVLLCDGMGTGAAAQADAQEAIRVLQSLLTLGFGPADAMAMLNELYLLRADGCFSTVDLLRLDLCSGEGMLYKWGAAPSYLKAGNTVKKIGTATPPPGLSVGEEHQVRGVGLSLQRGEQLVLTTDGVPENACQAYLRTCGVLSPRELAAGVVACASESEPDDRTAAVVQLTPVTMQPHHTTRRARSVSKSGSSPHI